MISQLWNLRKCFTNSLQQWFVLALLITGTAFFAKNKRYRWFYILAKTYRRDFRLLKAYFLVQITLRWLAFRNKTIATKFSELAKKHPQKVAFYFEDEVWTFEKVENYINKIARYFKSEGFQKGDCVALLLENRSEYPCIWLGLSKIGVITALINTNLVKIPLLHSLKVANCKAVVFGSNHAEPVKYVLDNLKSLKNYQYNETIREMKEILPNCVDLRQKLESISSDPFYFDFPFSMDDPLIYIYTSGTTGLPKPTVITSIRYTGVVLGLYKVTNFNLDDIIYTPLPLYHTAGGVIGIGLTIVQGLTVAIRNKFSASNYWTDCARYKCTVAQYIGETCRYVLAAPQQEPAKHVVRAILGNGLRSQIWKQFVDKYHIKEVFEMYGATEGISNMVNLDNTVGAVGSVPRYGLKLYPVTLIKCDEVTGEPIRDVSGHCIRCNVNEPGVAIGKISRNRSLFAFKGYVDASETEKKIIHNVFRDGDMYFNSGDLLEMDEFGTFFFKDRLGDTYRWKGENVSTTEVEAVISDLTQLNDAVVFGVEIPFTEGKGGMAAIVDSSKSLDLNFLSSALRNNLPPYAIPLFIRVMESVPITETFKLKKVELRNEGYNVDKIKDKIYFYNPTLQIYVPLTKDIYKEIMSGKLRF